MNRADKLIERELKGTRNPLNEATSDLRSGVSVRSDAAPVDIELKMVLCQYSAGRKWSIRCKMEGASGYGPMSCGGPMRCYEKQLPYSSNEPLTPEQKAEVEMQMQAMARELKPKIMALIEQLDQSVEKLMGESDFKPVY